MTAGPLDVDLPRHEIQSLPSTLQKRRRQAVYVRNACKRYGSKKDPCVVLDGLNMTVPKGVIYGLLGASGCGKTTLLNCIVGRKKLNSGEIWVLGGRPGSRGSGVPGPRIGYMPQDLALYGAFSIRETLRFFGWIAAMKDSQIEVRIHFLVKLFMLPDPDRMVQDLSTGQQRRVSLAAALLHEPELLILDEPTVGVDPLLRQIIWNLFVDITKNGHTTIIITTHYIDETRQANLIGLMRGGCFLAEESPDKLMLQMGVDTLEDVFLKLSIIQNMNRCRVSLISKEMSHMNNKVSQGVLNKSAVLEDVDSDDVSGKFGDNVSLHSNHSRRSSLAHPEEARDVQVFPDLPPIKERPAKISDYLTIWRSHHMKALVWRNFIWMIRNTPMMLFVILLPVIQIVLFCTCIGHDPINLPVALVNYETNNSINCRSGISCNSTELSCNYLDYLGTRALTLIPYDSEDSARESVVQGKTYASIVIQHNYSAALKSRIYKWSEVRSWDVRHSEIDVFRDVTTKTISTYLQVYMYETFQTFAEEFLRACDIDGRVLGIPVQWQTPVYGAHKPNFTDFVTPGIVLSTTFMLAAGLTALVLLIDRKEGTFERFLVAGISGIELLTAHAICDFVITVFQLVLTMAFTFAIFDITMVGSLTLVTILVLLSGLCGMSFGFVISCICDSERTVSYVVIGCFVPLIILCGIVWPIEAMHRFLKPFVYFFPLTTTTESMRSILQRGWGFSVKTVYTGFVSVGVWTFIFLAVSVLAVKFRRG